MSYEGYTNHFCSNGHYLAYRDCYDNDDNLYCFCGSKVFFTESIDETNGCCCEDGKTCCAHSHVLQKQIRVDKKPCHCNHGKVMVTKDYKTKEQIEIDCPNCQGTFQLDVPVYDVSSIDYRKA